MPQKVWEELRAQVDHLTTSEHEQREPFGTLTDSRQDETVYDHKMAA
jgi:hypothetical protein